MKYLVYRRCEIFEEVEVEATDAENAAILARQEQLKLADAPDHFLNGKLESVNTWTVSEQRSDGLWYPTGINK